MLKKIRKSGTQLPLLPNPIPLLYFWNLHSSSTSWVCSIAKRDALWHSTRLLLGSGTSCAAVAHVVPPSCVNWQNVEGTMAGRKGGGEKLLGQNWSYWNMYWGGQGDGYQWQCTNPFSPLGLAQPKSWYRLEYTQRATGTFLEVRESSLISRRPQS